MLPTTINFLPHFSIEKILKITIINVFFVICYEFVQMYGYEEGFSVSHASATYTMPFLMDVMWFIYDLILIINFLTSMK